MNNKAITITVASILSVSALMTACGKSDNSSLESTEITTTINTTTTSLTEAPSDVVSVKDRLESEIYKLKNLTNSDTGHIEFTASYDAATTSAKELTLSEVLKLAESESGNTSSNSGSDYLFDNYDINITFDCGWGGDDFYATASLGKEELFSIGCDTDFYYIEADNAISVLADGEKLGAIKIPADEINTDFDSSEIMQKADTIDKDSILTILSSIEDKAAFDSTGNIAIDLTSEDTAMYAETIVDAFEAMTAKAADVPLILDSDPSSEATNLSIENLIDSSSSETSNEVETPSIKYSLSAEDGTNVAQTHTAEVSIMGKVFSLKMLVSDDVSISMSKFDEAKSFDEVFGVSFADYFSDANLNKIMSGNISTKK